MILWNFTYHANVSDDTARDEGKRIELIYNKDRRINSTRGTFTNVRIIPLSRLDDQSKAVVATRNNASKWFEIEK